MSAVGPSCTVGVEPSSRRSGRAAVATPSGGRHLYFRALVGRVIGSSIGSTPAGRLGPGIDVRGPGRGSRGGYLVGPRSIVGARRYHVVVDAQIAELPGWLAGLLELAPVKGGGR